jgi:hypothetical protein
VVFSVTFVLGVEVNLILVVENIARDDSTNTDSVIVIELRLVEANGR